MKGFVRMTLLSASLLMGAQLFGAQISVRIGPPPPPRVVHVMPQSPGPGYVWIDGYWYPQGRHYRWHEGYWTRAPYGGATWVGPRYENGQYFNGYWEGAHGRVEHHHKWDRGHDRDYHEHERYEHQNHEH